MPSRKFKAQLKKVGKQVETAVRTVRDQVTAEAERVAASPTGQRLEREVERLGDQIGQEAERIAEQFSDGINVLQANATLHPTRHQATEILKDIQSDCKIIDERLKEAQELLGLIEKQSSEDDMLIMERGSVQAAVMLQQRSKSLEKKAEDERGHISNIPKLVNYDIEQTTLLGAQALVKMKEYHAKIKKNLEETSKIKETLATKYSQIKGSDQTEEFESRSVTPEISSASCDSSSTSTMSDSSVEEFGSRLLTLEASFAGCDSSSTSSMCGSSISSTSAPLLTSLTLRQETQPPLNPSTAGIITPASGDKEKSKIGIDIK